MAQEVVIFMNEDQVTIRKSMRDSVKRYHSGETPENSFYKKIIEFKGINNATIRIIDDALDPESQTVSIIRFDKEGKQINMLQLAAADFELLHELMTLDNREMRKLSDIDDTKKQA
jgi:hypothetical protein